MSAMVQDAEITMFDPGLERPLFDEVIETIRTTLSDWHRDSFCEYSDVPLLLDNLKTICNRNVKDTRRLQTCFQRTALFARVFAPFFDLLSIYGHVKGEWVGWYWGTLRIVFEAGTNYVLMLEKVADVFESIACALPNYQQLYDASRERLHFGPDERMHMLLSYTYADIMQCCLDMYRMFSRGAPGVVWRHRLSSPTSSTLLWRPLDSRLVCLEARLVHHNKWIQGETASLPGDHATKALHRREYIEFLEQQRIEAERSGELLVEKKMAKRMRRIDKIKAWLSNNCAYRDIFEHRARQRHPNTCTWFLNIAKYREWKNAPFDQASANNTDILERHWYDRVLFVQAKSGFGKSFISGAVIDDLEAEAEDLAIDDEHKPPSTAFFHFNAAHSYCTHPNDALRALAFQLIHTHRHDRKTLDAVSLLMRKMTAPTQASSNDVVTVLSLLLRQHPTFLVIDGIDECSDLELFLSLLSDLCKMSDVRAILFSRPEITFPLEYQKWASDSPHIIKLAEDSNSEDIRAFVSENLSRMADQGFFGINMDRSLLLKVSERSNGVFLWASLVLKYLQSSGLSCDERRSVLEHVEHIEGLECLYRHILNMLNLRPDREKQLATNLLRWLSLSINRMCMPGLHIAAAFSPTLGTSDTDNFSNYIESIPRLTCGLVEVTDCSIVFAHRSVKEHLQSPDFQDSPFSLYCEVDAHKHLAARCLSFLAHDMPKRPLGRLQHYIRPAPVTLATSSGVSMRTSQSGDSGYKSMSSVGSDSEGFLTVPSTLSSTLPPVPEQFTPAFEADIPFLRYASLCWPIHLSRALSSSTSTQPSQSPPPWQPSSPQRPFSNLPWLPPLSAFLTDRAAVTTWVEASWRFNLPPNLSRLVPLLDAVRAHVPPATVEGRELRWVVHGMRELREALNELKDEYGTTLRENPGLIWQWRGMALGVGAGGVWGLGGSVGNNGIGGRRMGLGQWMGGGGASGSYWPVWDERVGKVVGG
ncbi:hypothetical protein CC80DRAFT_292716 [Byssothecium circinans]|uniref:Nephrocystin 3-like N-terminal domain-containing protein n=1 Tax=Byssothecium circinans TaxID=147558 RepID=A0A6A5U5E1_9PLEO|nr:hypothetical protein CC80DRAFT_292716 [Byssothecium circinans]